MGRDVKFAAMIGVVLLLAVLIFSSYFTVGQNELTVVDRFGEFRYVAGPGLHFKVPLIDGTQSYRTDIRSWAIAFETADWPIRSCFAAPENDPASTTWTKTSIAAKRSIPHSNDQRIRACIYTPRRTRTSGFAEGFFE